MTEHGREARALAEQLIYDLGPLRTNERIVLDRQPLIEAITIALQAARATTDEKKALHNCYLLAMRMLHRSKPVDPEWTHIARFCKEVGCEDGSILRESRSHQLEAREP